MTKRHQQTLSIVARDRYSVLKVNPTQYHVQDKINKDLIGDFDVYSEARTLCNELNTAHLTILQWSLDDHIVSVQIELF